MKRINAWKKYSEENLQELEKVNKEYIKLLSVAKTERECVNETIRMAVEHGYRDLNEMIQNNESLKVGDKVYYAYMGRAILLYHIGEEPMENGMNIIGSHIDSPRIDVKQVPLFEEKGHVYLDTHYYGGIKKYQWLSTPLALHGVVVKKDGTEVNICIGEKEEDPVFVITDLLPHLGKDREQKKVSDFVKGEKLDLLIASRPEVRKGEGAEEKEEKEAVKKLVENILDEYYGIDETDFISAELEIVPAMKARECGIDRSMIMGYGQDDRVCAFTSLMALLEMKDLKKTVCCIMADKEEIGSVGATGMASRLFENTVAEVMDRLGDYSSLKARRAMANSFMLSSDVSAAFDPMYAEYFESKNVAYIGNGLVFNKYTGSRGKSGANDASPEYIAKLRKLMEDNNVCFQTAELGAVDAGGGGTIAYLMAEYGMHVIDCGMAVLGMHAPYEVTSKADVYEGYRGYKAFYMM